MKIHPTATSLAAILSVAAVVYVPALGGDFQFDDRDILVSPWLRDLAGFGSAATWWSLVRPLTALSFAVDHALSHFDVRGWHATSLAVHLVATVLAWFVARRAMARGGVPAPEASAIGATAVFALHPLQTEAVSYISQRAELLASACALGAVLMLLELEDARSSSRRRILAGAAIGLHAVGLTAKPSAAVAPLLWLTFVAVLPSPEDRDASVLQRILRALPRALPLVALSAVSAAVNIFATRGSAHAGFAVPGAPWPAHAATAVRALSRYLALALWPAGQTVDWYFPASATLLDPAALASAALLASTGALAFAGARRNGGAGAVARCAGFGLAFFAVALSPSLIVPLADPVAEHRAYLAVLGIAIAVSGCASLALAGIASARGRAAVAGVVAGSLLAALAWATAARNEVWQSGVALWRDAAAKSPEKARPHTNLCRALFLDGDPQGALRACDRALEIEQDALTPDQVSVTFEALSLMAVGRNDEARARILRHAERWPPGGETLALLAMAELAAGRLDDAERSARSAVARDGGGLAHVVLGDVWEARGDLASAAEDYAAAERAEPWESLAPYALGTLEERRGRLREACEAYLRASDAPGFSSTGKKARDRASRLGCSR